MGPTTLTSRTEPGGFATRFRFLLKPANCMGVDVDLPSVTAAAPIKIDETLKF
jgi:hypothetical protein